MPYIDVKCTIWRRFFIDDSEDAVEIAKKHEYSEFDSDLIDDTEEEMTPEENDNQSTIEVFDEDDNLLWSNEPIQVKRDKNIDTIII